jgi:hypothetical protein
MMRRVVITAGVALLIAIALAVVFMPASYPAYNEGKYYFGIAQFDASQAYSYYGARVLHPLFVRSVAAVAGMPLDAHVFLGVSIGSLVALFVLLGVHYGIEYSNRPWSWAWNWAWIWVLLPATATVIDQYRNYYWHDLFYAAVCALFFLALRANAWLSLPVLLALYLTRESTFVLVLVVVAVAALRRRWALAASALLVGIAGMVVDSRLMAHALPNHEGLPVFLLDALKIPYNFALNFCGLELWTNANAATVARPRWVAEVPAWLHLGNIRQIGFIGFNWVRPLQLLVVVCSAFGTLPALLGRLMAKGWGRDLFKRFDLTVAFGYGAMMFLLAPLTGTTPLRYELYAWPVFWLFGVGVVNAAISDARRRIELVLLCVVASWVPAIVRFVSGPRPVGPESINAVSTAGVLVSLLILAPIYVRTWRLSRTEVHASSLRAGRI